MTRQLDELLKKKRKALSGDNLELVANTCQRLAQLYFRDGRYEEALEQYKEEERLYSVLEKPIEVAVAHRMIGEVYGNMGEYEKALEHQNKHLEMAKDLNDQIEEQRALATIGRTFFCMAESISDKDNSDYARYLAEAKKAYLRSLNVCEKLKSVSKTEVMLMRSRLLLNLGLVLECQEDVTKGIEYIEKAIAINKQNDLYEDLYRCYCSLASLLVRQNNRSRALTLLNLALDIADRLPDKALLSCDALLSKAEVYFSQSDFQAAKQTLVKAYKMHSPNESDQKNVERLLKIAIALCRTEEKLRVLEETDFVNRKKLYEIMGDGSVAVKNFDGALIYYQKMLQCAEAIGDTEASIAAIYVSLSQTYKDKKEYDKALEFSHKELQLWHSNPAEACKTTLTIAQLMELKKSPLSEVQNVYEKARALAVLANDKKLEATVLRSLYYVQKAGGCNNLAEITKKELELTGYTEESETSDTEDNETPDIGDDVSLTDLSESENEEFDRSRVTRKRSVGLKVRRNEKGETQLHTACIAGNKALVKKLLEQGHPVNVRDHCGWLPLHEAANLGFPEIVEMLLDHGAAINDRGGALCGGITPLHDAALCGNLSTVQVLLNRGACVVTRTNEGKTPLDCLLEWYSQSGGLEADDQILFEAIERQLRNALERAGQSSVSTGELPRKIQKRDTPEAKRRKKAEGNRPKKAKRHESGLRRHLEDSSPERSRRLRSLSPVSDRSGSPIVSSSADVTGVDSNYSAPFGDKEVSSSCIAVSDSDSDGAQAREEYQRAIASLRTRTAQHTSSSSVDRENDVTNETGFLSVSDVGEDWLEDDLGIEKRPTKRKRTEAEKSGLIGSAGRQRVVADNVHSSDISPQRAYPNSSLNLNEYCLNPSTDDDYNIEDASQPCSSNERWKRQQPHKGRSSQLDVSTSHSGEISSSQRLLQSTSQASVAHAIRVCVEDKKFLIPVPDASLSIGWLVQETARRYYSLEGLRPTLTLQTSDGALLAEDDPISLITGSNELIASVVSWNLPPLTERYVEAAASLQSVADAHVLQVLEMCQATQCLQLADLALTSVSLSPVFQALRYQNTLSLNLSGNSLADDGMKLLAACILTMPQLKKLDISCNNISAAGLSHLSSSFSANKSLPLQGLHRLNLSCNPLGQEAVKHLQVIFTSLSSLTSLNLHACSLTSGPENMHQCLELLEELDVSFNCLGLEGARDFLKQISAVKIKELNLGSTQSGCEDGCSAIARDLAIFLGGAGCEPENLESLDLSNCNLKDTDIWELLRPLQKATNLKRLRLQGNTALTSVSLRCLLQLCIQQIDLSGCNSVLLHLSGTSPLSWLPPVSYSREIIVSADLSTVDWGAQCSIRKAPGGLLFITSNA
ncbi:tonsoku-like protein isoform X1 [Schistocerca piceifrons]|uniref:tonsoku-like protein isoform X1 n=1 Tax=Schistocerca piceifrons TaxID=274613 RepID=UPI001F5FC24B|nr:tonsoku-like protein isoform X1 [Schistocerca piceifrons]